MTSSAPLVLVGELEHEGEGRELSVDRNPWLLYLATLAPSSRATQEASIGVMLREACGWTAEPWAFPWRGLRYIHLVTIQYWIVGRYAPSSSRRIRSALLGIMRQCYRLGDIAESDYRHAIDLPTIRGSRPPKDRKLGPGELRALFVACGDGAIGIRDRALLATIYGAGLRKSEAVALLVEELEGSALRVLGKGDKVRIVPLPIGTQAALSLWLAVRGLEPGPLFWATDGKGSRLAARRMSRESIRPWCEKLARRAGIARFSPHDLRASYVGDLLDLGVDLSTVSKMVGHASPVTTARYDRRDERTKAAAAGRLNVPSEP